MMQSRNRATPGPSAISGLATKRVGDDLGYLRGQSKSLDVDLIRGAR